MYRKATEPQPWIIPGVIEARLAVSREPLRETAKRAIRTLV